MRFSLQPDGKLVAVGDSRNANQDSACALIRYNPDGSLDSTFGSGGIVQADISSAFGASDAALQPDGKIVVSAGAWERGWILARFEPDGDLDRTFGGNGVVIDPAPRDVGSASVVSLQADGKIVLASRRGAARVAFARFLPDGLVDTGFGKDGLVVTVAGDFAGVSDVDIQPDGKVVVVGGFFGSKEQGGQGFLVVRYKPSGALDPSFGSRGVVMYPTYISTEFEAASALILDPDGKIVAGGRGWPTDSDHTFPFALVRYEPDGSLDPSFGSDGMVKTIIGASQEIFNGVAVQPDSRIVGIGSYDAHFAVIRYMPDGSLDYQFHPSGIRVEGDAQVVRLQPDHKIVVAGDDKLARYTQNGTLDESFGTNGIATLQAGEKTVIRGLALLPRGKIVVAGWVWVSPTVQRFLVARYNDDGILDSRFGQGGVVITSFGRGSDRANAVGLEPDGKIVVAGDASTDSGKSTFAVARYTSSGKLDRAFGKGGRVITASGSDARANGLVVQPDGRIAVGGRSLLGSDESEIALVRYKKDGSLDSTFGEAGVVQTQLESGSAWSRALALQPNGKIIAAGSLETDTGSRFTLVRYLRNGGLDRSFGTGGVVTTEFGSSPGTNYANALALQHDGKIIAAGHGCCEGFALARYRGDDCIVPHVTGKRLARAKAAIRRGYCLVGRVDRRFSSARRSASS